MIVMFLLFIPLSFLIPSSSGLATVAMPIMVPLGRVRRTCRRARRQRLPVRSGLVNLFTPTSAVVMGGLAIARVPYGTLPAMGVAAADPVVDRRRDRPRGGSGAVMTALQRSNQSLHPAGGAE